ncbi:hypothetical protein M747DRAFT_246453 [Aspergillus niger ATCC 13496]|uniref:Contig An09c0170, genomic contig n=3 Tax=Aspergillus niger TaxID=5061 RepID=A2QUG4_ASPNC|nr:uncharacterized protein An09g05570 [Aspergillus niger]RDH15797.1 hypothetical protein M747DRAFT_246453 [Aspergillus niger ATCC 13496]CAL00833.1 unnamed protein product [Aspergillus niger]
MVELEIWLTAAVVMQKSPWKLVIQRGYMFRVKIIISDKWPVRLKEQESESPRRVVLLLAMILLREAQNSSHSGGIDIQPPPPIRGLLFRTLESRTNMPWWDFIESSLVPILRGAISWPRAFSPEVTKSSERNGGGSQSIKMTDVKGLSHTSFTILSSILDVRNRLTLRRIRITFSDRVFAVGLGRDWRGGAPDNFIFVSYVPQLLAPCAQTLVPLGLPSPRELSSASVPCIGLGIVQCSSLFANLQQCLVIDAKPDSAGGYAYCFCLLMSRCRNNKVAQCWLGNSVCFSASNRQPQGYNSPSIKASHENHAWSLAISGRRPKEDGSRYPKKVGNGRGGEIYHRPPHAPFKLHGRVGFSITLVASFADDDGHGQKPNGTSQISVYLDSTKDEAGYYGHD